MNINYVILIKEVEVKRTNNNNKKNCRQFCRMSVGSFFSCPVFGVHACLLHVPELAAPKNIKNSFPLLPATRSHLNNTKWHFVASPLPQIATHKKKNNRPQYKLGSFHRNVDRFGVMERIKPHNNKINLISHFT